MNLNTTLVNVKLKCKAGIIQKKKYLNTTLVNVKL